MSQEASTKYDTNSRLSLERAWAEQGAKRFLVGDNWRAWQALRSSHRFFLSVGQTLLLWAYEEDVPTIQDTLRIEDFEACPINGLAVTAVDGAGHKFRLDHAPQLVHGVFLYVPRFCDLQFFTREGEAEPALRFGLIARMRHNPDTRSPGVTYVSTASALKGLFPTNGAV